jgi:hypothetical protein
MWVVGQAFITDIPLFDAKIGRLQGIGLSHFFSSENFFPNPPSSLSLPNYLEAMALHFSRIPSPLVQKKHNIYNSSILCYIEDEVVE